MADSPVAGWYDDPADETMLRYWDGAAWTGRVRPKNAPPAAPPMGTASAGGFSGAAYGGTVAVQKNSGLAIASLVLGLLFCVPFASLVGLILGIVALNQIKNSGGAIQGRGMAIAGIVLGAISMAIGILYAIAVLADSSSGY